MFKDLTGQFFGYLTVLASVPTKKGFGVSHCLCYCGKEIVARNSRLLCGHIKSCGCRQFLAAVEKTTKHGMSGTPEHHCWKSIRKRCKENARLKHKKMYFDRSITVCERWSKFENFFADMGFRPSPEHSIDRIDNDKGYSPDNCRWATQIEQQNNRRDTLKFEINGITRSFRDWCRLYNQPHFRVYMRLKYGWDIEKALSAPHRDAK